MFILPFCVIFFAINTVYISLRIYLSNKIFNRKFVFENAFLQPCHKRFLFSMIHNLLGVNNIFQTWHLNYILLWWELVKRIMWRKGFLSCWFQTFQTRAKIWFEEGSITLYYYSSKSIHCTLMNYLLMRHGIMYNSSGSLLAYANVQHF